MVFKNSRSLPMLVFSSGFTINVNYITKKISYFSVSVKIVTRSIRNGPIHLIES